MTKIQWRTPALFSFTQKTVLWVVYIRACGLRAAGVKIEHGCSSSTGNRRMLPCVRESAAPALSQRCQRGCTSVGACPSVTVALLTHALQTMLFLQGLAAQRAGGTTGEGTWHQVMPVPRFLFGLLPLLSLLLFVSVLTLQRNKGDKHRGRRSLKSKCSSLLFGRDSFSKDDIVCFKEEGSRFFVYVVKNAASQVHLVFVEGAGHPVPQRAELPPHLGAFLHLLCSVLLVFVSDQTSKKSEIHRKSSFVKKNTGKFD